MESTSIQKDWNNEINAQNIKEQEVKNRKFFNDFCVQGNTTNV